MQCNGVRHARSHAIYPPRGHHPPYSAVPKDRIMLLARRNEYHARYIDNNISRVHVCACVCVRARETVSHALHHTLVILRVSRIIILSYGMVSEWRF